MSQVPNENSYHRIVRAGQLPVPVDMAGVVRVLGDTTDPISPPGGTLYQVGLLIAMFRLSASASLTLQAVACCGAEWP